MSTGEISTWLQEGLAAAKAGERARARELLMRVVEVDENNLQAWLWLSGVVTTLEDREACLENVLTLDPTNEAARKGLDWVRAQIEATPEIEPESILPRVEPAAADKISVNFADDEFDDPLLCVYCGRPTKEADQRCPHCRRSLYLSYLKRERPGWLWVGWTLSVIDVVYSLAALLILLVILAITLTAAQFDQRAVDVTQLLALYFGQPAGLAVPAQNAAFTVLPREVFYFRLGYIIFMGLTTVGLPTRKRLFHLMYIAGLAAGLVGWYLATNQSRIFIASGAPTAPLQGVVQVALNEVLGVFNPLVGALAIVLLVPKALLAYLMEDDFERVTERLWSVIDRSVRESSAAFVRAKSYMKRDMWTLAAMYLQLGLSLQPAAVDYQLALAECYARLGRYRQSLALLDQSAQLQPGSPVVAGLREVVIGLESEWARRQQRPPESSTVWESYGD
jgi:tetratricopeptide (TPR) repeat protein